LGEHKEYILEITQLSLSHCELVLLAFMLTAAFAMPGLGSSCFRKAEQVLGRIAKRRWLSVGLVGLVGLGSGAGVSLYLKTPEPGVHDEFSYLLAADTFSRGRLANPTHPMWVHFESFHIIQQPTYASKFPPAQGLMLAAGQLICGRPIAGVWISLGLACASICWMLQAWLTPSWALLGGWIAISRLGFLGGLFPAIGHGYWGQSYWGGAVAATGGAMVLGSLRRLLRRPLMRYALLLGLGMAVLANSRPYEGLLMSLPCLAWLLVWIFSKKGLSLWLSMKSIVLPLLALLLLTGLAMGYYNLCITGKALRTPYQLHDQTYGVPPVFLWQRPTPEPTYRHEVMRNLYRGWRLQHYFIQRRLDGFLNESEQKIRTLWSFYIGLLLTIPLVMLPWISRNQWMRFALLTFLVLLGGVLLVTGVFPHYAAPITGLVFAFVLQGMRHLRLYRWRGRASGLFIVRVIPVIYVLLIVAAIAKIMRSDVDSWRFDRAHILSRLRQKEGLHLVIVRYGPKHTSNAEWVYNEADIDHAKIVLAREMDESQNHRLIHYFKDRHVWLLEADKAPPKVVPYSMGSKP
jgi:hypothetical protein